MGKAPLRLVAERVPVFITSATRPAYWVETLNCGHTVEAYQHFEDGDSVSPIPFAKRRRCLHCKEQLSDIKPVLPLPPGKLLHVGKFSERVINRLHEAKFKEINPWIKDDLHVSAMAVHYAAQGYGKPWEWAFLHYYGKHDFKLIPYWLEQDAKRALLGPGLSNESLILPPKKPSVSVKPAKKEDVA